MLEQQTKFIMLYMPAVLLLSLAVRATSLTINVVVQLRDGVSQGRTNSGWNLENIGSSVSIAIEDFQARGILTEHTFRIIYRDSLCNPGKDMKILADVRFNDRPDMWIGMGCSISNIPLGRYLSNWRIPFFPIAGTHPTLSDKAVYTTLIRIHAAGDKMAKAFTSVFNQYGWRRAAMVTSYGFCSLQAVPTNKELKLMGVTVTEWIQADQEGTPEYLLSDYLDRVRERARVIIACLDNDEDQLLFLRLAHSKGMLAPDYVFFSYGHDPNQGTYEPWTYLGNLGPEEVKEWQKILTEINYKTIYIAALRGPEIEAFYDLVPVRLSQPPWNYNTSLERGWRGSPKAVDIHDGTVSYLVALNEILAEGGDWRNGDLIQDKLRNRVVYGLRGKFLFDEKADRIPDYWIMDLQPGWKKYKEVVMISLAEPPEKRFIPIDNGSVYWGTVDNHPPPDSPVCGFQNELCPVDNTTTNLIVGISVCGILLVVFGLLFVILYRRHKEEEALQQTVWKVSFTDIVTRKRRTGSESNTSQKSMQSATSEGSGQLGTRQTYAEIGTYKGNLVAILRVNKPRVTLSQTDLKELKAMKNMSHDNLAVFVGACVEAPNICYIMQYYTKGSLMDLLENDVIGLDWMFKTSLISDLARGMAYLHKSLLGSHGSLKSSSCLVDSRMQLKVSSFGLHAFRSDQSGANLGEYEKYGKLLWTSPELLRMQKSQRPRYGTQKGDVYSFGVITQEVIYRTAPYFMDTESPKSIISKLIRGGPKPFRPILPKVESDTPPDASKLVDLCWAEDPSERPSFEQIAKFIREMNQNKEVDIMSSMIEKLEKYANNLEDIVNQRTSQLLVEKQKTDSLLYRMLPESIAEHLKNGEAVHAELYEAVTIYFSDIVGFTALSLESTPLEVVNLLNDLYSMFDDIIELHEVYKVETIGDSYMVVSGLPHRNGDKHAGEIANLALDLMSAAVSFRIRHRPGLALQLRVGFHTGPCAAGVVGLSMPRYCLFGDTVNMSSRMETNGKALRIHMSQFSFAALEKLGGYHIRPRGEMQIKGKGLQMTYWLLGRDGYNKPLPVVTDD